jgi:hypothetical protein
MRESAPVCQFEWWKMGSWSFSAQIQAARWLCRFPLALEIPTSYKTLPRLPSTT